MFSIMYMLTSKYLMLLFLLLYTTVKSKQEGLDEDPEGDLDDTLDPAEGEVGVVNILENVENSSQIVDRSEEEWVKDAVLDVAYYLRAHKFNDFDRRYFKEASSEDAYQYRHFPNPPLRYLHWEVSKYCEKGFYDCLGYLHDTVLKAGLIRAQDTNVVMNKRHWEFPRNAKAIEKLDQECQRLKTADWRDADPFKGPLERFQWRVSASYFMCFYSMQDFSPLVMFGERCDNFASCLSDKSPFNGDPRGDDSFPYQCALYSFCPDVCCPLKKVNDIEQCLDTELNPCHWHKDRAKRVCSLSREMNRDLTSIALNQWNVTCSCDPGFEWRSEFGACVDVDECSQGTHNCTPTVETCINLKVRSIY